MPRNFLSDDDSADGRGDDCWFLAIDLRMKRAKLLRQLTTDLSCHGCILQEQGTLEKLPAVKTGAKDEMAMEQGSSLFEKSKDVGHSRNGLRLKTIRLKEKLEHLLGGRPLGSSDEGDTAFLAVEEFLR